jgi:hypothetical protein
MEKSYIAFCYKFDTFFKFFRLRQILTLCEQIATFLLGSMIVGSGVLVLQYEHDDAHYVLLFGLLAGLRGQFLCRID